MNKSIKFINLVFQDGIIPISYQTLGRCYKNMPNQIFKFKEIPIKSSVTTIIKSGEQQILNANLIVNILPTFYEEILLPFNLSCMESHITPGLLIPGHQDILLLAANLYKHQIEIKKRQTIAYLHLFSLSNIAEIKKISDLSYFNIPTSSYILSVISRFKLVGLLPQKKDQAIALFDKYKEIFATSDFDLGCIEEVSYYIDIGDNFLIKLHLICQSIATEVAVDKEITELIDR